MKRLTLIRHAQAESALPGQSDYERTLTRRGMADAAEMARRLKLAKVRVDFVLSSPAPRAQSTADIFARALKVPAERVDTDDRLYTAGPNEYKTSLLDYGREHQHLLIVAHNPGLTEFADKLSFERRIEAMPTCAVATMQFDIDDWSELNWRQGTQVELDYPGIC